jgi:dynein heavy chain
MDQACNALGDLDGFGKFTSDLVEAAPRFREWYNLLTPESEKLPLDWAGTSLCPKELMPHTDRAPTGVISLVVDLLWW